jgi:hypothetical protein
MQPELGDDHFLWPNVTFSLLSTNFLHRILLSDILKQPVAIKDEMCSLMTPIGKKAELYFRKFKFFLREDIWFWTELNWSTHFLK